MEKAGGLRLVSFRKHHRQGTIRRNSDNWRGLPRAPSATPLGARGSRAYRTLHQGKAPSTLIIREIPSRIQTHARARDYTCPTRTPPPGSGRSAASGPIGPHHPRSRDPEPEMENPGQWAGVASRGATAGSAPRRMGSWAPNGLLNGREPDTRAGSALWSSLCSWGTCVRVRQHDIATSPPARITDDTQSEDRG